MTRSVKKLRVDAINLCSVLQVFSLPVKDRKALLRDPFSVIETYWICKKGFVIFFLFVTRKKVNKQNNKYTKKTFFWHKLNFQYKKSYYRLERKIQALNCAHHMMPLEWSQFGLWNWNKKCQKPLKIVKRQWIFANLPLVKHFYREEALDLVAYQTCQHLVGISPFLNWTPSFSKFQYIVKLRARACLY